MTRHILKYALLGLALGLVAFAGAPPASAATNISATTTQHWAWNDAIGWLDFYNTNTVMVTSGTVQGYASSSAGIISLDCATSPSGNICGTSNYSVSNDGYGDLSGYAWNDVYGWISFDCANNGGCGASSYRVYIDNAGDFQNYAWNDVVGWISFNCVNNPGGCGQSDYKVTSSWLGSNSIFGSLDSSTFDTGVSAGAHLNSVLWQGSQPAGTSVGFQFAVSNSSSGPWTYWGPGQSATLSYAPSVNTSQALDFALFNDFRYFRYRMLLYSDSTKLLTPRVDDVMVNWSR